MKCRNEFLHLPACLPYLRVAADFLQNVPVRFLNKALCASRYSEKPFSLRASLAMWKLDSFYLWPASEQCISRLTLKCRADYRYNCNKEIFGGIGKIFSRLMQNFRFSLPPIRWTENRSHNAVARSCENARLLHFILLQARRFTKWYSIRVNRSLPRFFELLGNGSLECHNE